MKASLIRIKEHGADLATLGRTWGCSQCPWLQYNSWPELYSPFQEIPWDGLTRCDASRTVPRAHAQTVALDRIHHLRRAWDGTEQALFLQALFECFHTVTARREKSNKGQGCRLAREFLLSIVPRHFRSSLSPSMVVVCRRWPRDCKCLMGGNVCKGGFDILLLHLKHKKPLKL